MCEIELEPCKVWSETKRRARKQHRCDCCRGPIQPGEHYLKHFDIFEGVVSSERMCLTCEPLREAFSEAHQLGLCAPSYFPELLDNCIADGDEESEQRWKPMLDAIRQRRAAAREATHA